jgi:hypothetical protein
VAGASITNTEMIERFYHPKMLILASEKLFRSATLQNSCIEEASGKDFYTCGGKGFSSPSLVKLLLCTHLLKLFRTFTFPNPRSLARPLGVSGCSIQLSPITARWKNIIQFDYYFEVNRLIK